jgi:hypothetical protein
MFTAFIAIALELLALAMGAAVLLACCRDCFRGKCVKSLTRTDDNKNRVEVTRTDDTRNKVEVDRTHPRTEYCKREHQKCHGFLKSIGYFTIIVSVIGLIGTCVALSCFLMDVKQLENDTNGPVEQYNYDLNKLRKYSDNYRLLPRAVEQPLTIPAPTTDTLRN